MGWYFNPDNEIDNKKYWNNCHGHGKGERLRPYNECRNHYTN